MLLGLSENIENETLVIFRQNITKISQKKNAINLLAFSLLEVENTRINDLDQQNKIESFWKRLIL